MSLDSTLLDRTLQRDIEISVQRALAEDIGEGDITAQLVPADKVAKAVVVTRESAVLCGQAWVAEVYRQLDPDVAIDWVATDGQQVEAGQTLYTLQGKARSLLTGERVALNFLQTLSGVATTAREFANLVGNSGVKVLDTRKTIPGLRLAQKYAVKIGGCDNHRMGLYDAFLIKENHIAACGGITAAIDKARRVAPGKPVEVEVENLDELRESVAAGADIVMLDNFSQDMTAEAVQVAKGQVKLEISGNITQKELAEAAAAGVDFVSSGALTKHCRAIDLSFRLMN